MHQQMRLVLLRASSVPVPSPSHSRNAASRLGIWPPGVFAFALRLELVLAFGFAQNALGGVLSGLRMRLWTVAHALRRHRASDIPCSVARSCLLLLIFCSRTPAGARPEGLVRTSHVSPSSAPPSLACVRLRPWLWCYLSSMRAPRYTPHRWTSSLN